MGHLIWVYQQDMYGISCSKPWGCVLGEQLWSLLLPWNLPLLNVREGSAKWLIQKVLDHRKPAISFCQLHSSGTQKTGLLASLSYTIVTQGLMVCNQEGVSPIDTLVTAKTERSTFLTLIFAAWPVDHCSWLFDCTLFQPLSVDCTQHFTLLPHNIQKGVLRIHPPQYMGSSCAFAAVTVVSMAVTPPCL